jgi:putative ATP-dependent endonuclease of OLD family
MLVFALLSMIADEKQNVMFAMEEPEIAIPPYTQKRVIESVKSAASQVLLTSHSPYVLEEFAPSRIAVLQRDCGTLSITPASLPPTVKMKAYSSEMRTRFSEALLARRVLVVEGRTEFDAFPAASRRLAELIPEKYRSLDSLGIAIVDARTDSQIVAVQTDESAIRKFLSDLYGRGDWPLSNTAPPDEDTSTKILRKILVKVLSKRKGSGEAAELLADCDEHEMPAFIIETLSAIQEIVDPPVDVVGDIEEGTDLE